MSLSKPVAISVIAIAGAFILNLITLSAFGLLDPKPQTLVVDARQVVRIFVEKRGEELTDAELKGAILVFDQIVVDEATAIFNETGNIMINADHMLAGGVEVSALFADRVIARWDALQ